LRTASQLDVPSDGKLCAYGRLRTGAARRGRSGERMMNHVTPPRKQVVNLIKAENQGGPSASAAASKMLTPNFLGITRQGQGAEPRSS
jgi:hypothetical protein